MRKIIKLLFLCLTMYTLFACGSSTGSFKVIDGKEIYIEGNQQVIDKLVEVSGEKYYIGNDGTKVVNDWAVIDNDGTYAYFGAKGQMIKNQIKEINGNLYLFDKNGNLETNCIKEFDGSNYYADKNGVLLRESIIDIDGKEMYFNDEGKLIKKTGWVENKMGMLPAGSYYLDENGQRVKDKWIDEYYLNSDGKMVVNQWVGDYYVGSDGRYLKDTITPDGKKVGVDGKVLLQAVAQISQAVSSVNNINDGINGIGNAIGNQLIDAISSDLNGEHANDDLYIEKSERIKDSYELNYTDSRGDKEREIEKCEFIINKPIVKGKDANEVAKVNELIEVLLNEFINDRKTDDMLINEGTTEYDNYCIEYIRLTTTHEFTNIDYTWKGSKDKIFGFSLEGKYKQSRYKSESNFVITFVYDRKDMTAQLYIGNATQPPQLLLGPGNFCKVHYAD